MMIESQRPPLIGSRPIGARNKLLSDLLLMIYLSLAVLTFSQAENAIADTGKTHSPNQQRRPLIGLALSGGGARGLAHIGVLQVLERERIPIDFIAGTSMGSIVGGTYASGMSVEQMTEFVTEIDWTDVFQDNPDREALSWRRKELDRRDLFGLELGVKDRSLQVPQGAIAGQKLDLVMGELGRRAEGIRNFDQLPIPFRCVATDLETGEMVVFEGGSLTSAMRASMSVPGVVAPVEYQNRLLVDGGLVRNLPVDIVRGMGAEIVIAVNLGTPLLKRDELGSVFGVAIQMINILTEQNVQRSLDSLGEGDVLITPDLGDISSASFERAEDAIETGIAAAEKSLPRLRRYSVSRTEYLIHKGRHRAKIVRSDRPVDEIRIGKLERVNPEVIKDELQTKVGENLNEDTLKEDLARLYGRGDFERINYRYFNEAGRGIVAIDAFEKRWGPNYLRSGVGMESDFQGITNFNLRGSFDATWLNSRGGEWRNDLQIGKNTFLSSEFFQPFAAGSGFFVAPHLTLTDRFENLFEGDRNVAEYQIKSARAGLDLGRGLGNWGELRVGLSAAGIDSGIESGENALPSENVFQGAITGSLAVDTLDNARFPSEGNRGIVQILASLDQLGSDDHYIKLQGNWDKGLSFGKNILNLGLMGGTNLADGDLPPYDELILGGFLRLSGYRPEQLRGQELAFGRMIYYRRLMELPRPLGNALYAGGSLEAGNAWDGKTDIPDQGIKTGGSVFIGADTILGPLYLGYGYASQRNNSLYLLVGKP